MAKDPDELTSEEEEGPDSAKAVLVKDLDVAHADAAAHDVLAATGLYGVTLSHFRAPAALCTPK